MPKFDIGFISLRGGACPYLFPAVGGAPPPAGGAPAPGAGVGAGAGVGGGGGAFWAAMAWSRILTYLSQSSMRSLASARVSAVPSFFETKSWKYFLALRYASLFFSSFSLLVL